jgi:glyoxylase-like metal-dependent hydrolase (beta-lactamase superfamily II)
VTNVHALLLSAALVASSVQAQTTTPLQPPKPEIRTEQIRPGLVVLTGAGGNVAAWSGPDGVVLVDDGLGTLSQQLLAAVQAVAPGEIRFVLNTHWHPDHTGGNEKVADRTVILAHENVRKRLGSPQTIEEYEIKLPAAAKAALPVVTIDQDATLHLNGDHLEALHVPAAHTDGDLVLWWETANVVHTGDLFYNGSYPFIDASSGGTVAGLVAALETVLARADENTLIIPGHGPTATRRDFAAYRDMVVAVAKEVRRQIEQGRSLDEVLAAQPTAPFDERFGKGPVKAERFVRALYRDFSSARVPR